MNRDVSYLLGPLLAVVLLAVVLFHTGQALREAGAFARPEGTPVVDANDPYVGLDRRLADPVHGLFDQPMRDPFGGPLAAAGTPAPDTAHARRVTPRTPPRPLPPPVPVLTAIIYDSDPRAVLRWNGTDFTVRQGGLFDVFQVVGISRDQVVLKRGEESIVLKRTPGD